MRVVVGRGGGGGGGWRTHLDNVEVIDFKVRLEP